MFELGLRPSLRSELRAEVSAAFADPSMIGTLAAYDTLAALPLLNKIINETLRLRTPAILVTREALEDDYLPSKDGEPPLFIEKGTYIFISQVRCFCPFPLCSLPALIFFQS